MRKSRKTFNRIQQIKRQLRCHEKNIERLYFFSKGDAALTRKKMDDHRMRWTIKNISDQMQLLRLELTVLMEYGA